MSYWQVDVRDVAPDMVGCRFRVRIHPLVQHHISAVRVGTKPSLAHSQYIKLKFYNFQFYFLWRLLGCPIGQADVRDVAPDMVGCRFRVHLHPLVQHHVSAVRLGAKPRLAHYQNIKLKFYNFQFYFSWRLLGCPVGHSSGCSRCGSRHGGVSA